MVLIIVTIIVLLIIATGSITLICLLIKAFKELKNLFPAEFIEKVSAVIEYILLCKHEKELQQSSSQGKVPLLPTHYQPQSQCKNDNIDSGTDEGEAMDDEATSTTTSTNTTLTNNMTWSNTNVSSVESTIANDKVFDMMIKSKDGQGFKITSRNNKNMRMTSKREDKRTTPPTASAPQSHFSPSPPLPHPIPPPPPHISRQPTSSDDEMPKSHNEVKKRKKKKNRKKDTWPNSLPSKICQKRPSVDIPQSSLPNYVKNRTPLGTRHNGSPPSLPTGTAAANIRPRCSRPIIVQSNLSNFKSLQTPTINRVLPCPPPPPLSLPHPLIQANIPPHHNPFPPIHNPFLPCNRFSRTTLSHQSLSSVSGVLHPSLPCSPHSLPRCQPHAVVQRNNPREASAVDSNEGGEGGLDLEEFISSADNNISVRGDDDDDDLSIGPLPELVQSCVPVQPSNDTPPLDNTVWEPQQPVDANPEPTTTELVIIPPALGIRAILGNNNELVMPHYESYKEPTTGDASADSGDDV